MTASRAKPPVWLRVIQIVLGVITVGLSVQTLVFPLLGIEVAILILSIALIVIGFERIGVGIGSIGVSKWSPSGIIALRAGNIALGAIAVGLGFASLVYPVFATELLVLMLSIGLLFAGFAKIIQGIDARIRSGWSRVLLIGVGTLATIAAVAVMLYPISLGIPVLVMLVSIGLLLLGAEAIISGIFGERYLGADLGTDTRSRIKSDSGS